MCWCYDLIANLSVSINSEQARERYRRFAALVDSVDYCLKIGSVGQWRWGSHDAAPNIAMLGTALLTWATDSPADPL